MFTIDQCSLCLWSLLLQLYVYDPCYFSCMFYVTFENIVARSEGEILLASAWGAPIPPFPGRGAVAGVVLQNISSTIAVLGNSSIRGRLVVSMMVLPP